VPRRENAELYARYKQLADETEGVHFVGRLATYKYYNMDQIVAQALTTYAKMSGAAKRSEATALTLPARTNGDGRAHAQAAAGHGNGRGAV
jgi:UDP-galactopyranose mutase